MFKSRLLLILSVLLSGQFAVAAKVNEVQWTFDSYLFGEQQDFSESKINPGNAILQQPQVTYTLDNRAEMKWLINDAKIIVRPRWIFTRDSVKNDLTGENKDTAIGRLDMTDAFLEQIVSRKFSATVGLQVYQWGPGELFNPSNPFFRFNNRQQTFTFKEKGHVLMRLNYSFNIERSLVLIAEPVSNREAFWMEGKEFSPQSALKFEHNWRNTRNYYGLLIGTEAQQNTFIGEYAHYEFLPGFSMYLDAKHSYELARYAPVLNSSGMYDMELFGEKDKKLSHLALAGLRYEGDVDVRLEYLYNSAGYGKNEYDEAVNSASNFLNPKYVQNLTRFVYSGLNFQTRNYLYFSLRVMEPFTLRDFNIYARTLYSLMDQSGLVQAEFDKAVSDSVVIFGSYTQFNGGENSEFRLLNDWKALFGLKYTL